MSKMAEEWREITHYASVAEITDDGEKKLIIVDAERDSFCRKHGLSFAEYIADSLYFAPQQINIENKLANGGAGPLIHQVLATNPKHVKGDKKLNEIIGDMRNEVSKNEKQQDSNFREF